MSKTTASAAWLTQFGLLMWKNWTLSVLLSSSPSPLSFFFSVFIYLNLDKIVYNDISENKEKCLVGHLRAQR
jgi:hypothetical protein